MVSVLAIGPKFAGLYPAEDDGFLRLIEIHHIFLRRRSKSGGPLT
jgi:hypothetical protein